MSKQNVVVIVTNETEINNGTFFKRQEELKSEIGKILDLNGSAVNFYHRKINTVNRLDSYLREEGISYSVCFTTDINSEKVKELKAYILSKQPNTTFIDITKENCVRSQIVQTTT